MAQLLRDSNDERSAAKKTIFGPTQTTRSEASPNAAGPPEACKEEEEEEIHGKNQLLAMAPSWLFSFVSHLVLILVLAFWLLPLLPEKEIALNSGTENGAMDESIDLKMDEFDEFDDAMETETMETEFQDQLTDVGSTVELPATEVSPLGQLFPSAQEMANNTVPVLESGGGNELSGRTTKSRKQLAKANGASGESEESVDLALEWIVKHQLPNGSWNFDHTQGEGSFRQTPGAGTATEAKIGATAMALLPLLGAGHTHISGESTKRQ